MALWNLPWLAVVLGLYYMRTTVAYEWHIPLVTGTNIARYYMCRSILPACTVLVLKPTFSLGYA